ncbi:phosphotransferase [Actinoplanes sp. GCM10030250]|uniref:phosphotransferase n=1 Tax=Actinoplanes sp. GCM10030250 TaxID=3273376 RepID=UPI00360C91DB
MREPPRDLTEEAVISALRAGWEIEAATTEYLPVGAGSHHWSVRDRGGATWFVKVDDLGAVPAGREAAFDRLRRSLMTAVTLRRESGLDFVLAPVPAPGGEALRRLSSRYGLSLYPLLEGSSGDFTPHPPADRQALVEMLAALHRTGSSTASDTASSPSPLSLPGLSLPGLSLPGLSLPRPSFPGRSGLEEALRDTGRPWTAGPYAEPTRAALTTHTTLIQKWLTDFDQLAESIGDPARWVLTHGEPHPGNLLHTPGGLLLIDWDTAGVAPPERDLWMLTSVFAEMLGEKPSGDDAAVLDRYAELTGHQASTDALAFYRLWWVLADIAIYTDQLRRPHVAGADLAASLSYLTGNLQASWSSTSD